MATSTKNKLKQGPLDVWSIRERLSLASSVLRSGDQNWVSVSRAIKPYGEPDRPPEWFSQKNCALQYSDLLEKVETPKRKRTDRGEIEAPGKQIIRKLSIERMEELKKMVVEEQQKYKRIKKEVEMVKSGQWDDKLPEIWAAIQTEKAALAEKKSATPKKSAEESYMGDLRKGDKLKPARNVSENEDNTLDTVFETGLGLESMGEDSNQLSSALSFTVDQTNQILLQLKPAKPPLTLPPITASKPTISPMSQFPTTPVGSMVTHLTTPGGQPAGAISRTPRATPPSSPLLSSLLKSKHHAPEFLQQVKNEAEAQEQAAHALAAQVTPPLTTSQLATYIDSATNQTQDIRSHTSPIKMPVSVPVTEVLPTSPSTAAPTLSKLLAVPAVSKAIATGSLVATPIPSLPEHIITSHDIKQEIVELTWEMPGANTSVGSELSTFGDVLRQETVIIEPEIVEVKEEIVVSVEETTTFPQHSTTAEQDENADENSDITNVHSRLQCAPPDPGEENTNQSLISVDDEISIKEEPLSPCSSVSSRVSESGGSRGSRQGRARGKRSRGGRRSTRLTRQSLLDDEKKDKDDASSKHSDVETSDDERGSDESVIAAKFNTPTAASIFSESIPNSPLSQCSDTEDERAYKSWKKSIMLVWRAAAMHKFASLFLHPVTNDIAPGYKNIVHRPMDLSVIKKNVESGVIRTTPEFQRDMMLMFTNAIMYNSSDHDVYKMAVDMYNDVLQHIEQYVSTQFAVQTSETKILRGSRRSDNSDKEEDPKKRTSADQQDGGKIKKRKL